MHPAERLTPCAWQILITIVGCPGADIPFLLVRVPPSLVGEISRWIDDLQLLIDQELVTRVAGIGRYVYFPTRAAEVIVTSHFRAMTEAS